MNAPKRKLLKETEHVIDVLLHDRLADDGESILATEEEAIALRSLCNLLLRLVGPVDL